MVLMPEASTPTAVTSARPIISAAAVDAVRAGFRIAFSRASRPETPPVRAPNHPSQEASHGTRCGAANAMPMKLAITPTPIASSRWPPERLVPSPPSRSSASATASTATAAGTPKRASLDGGRTPSRTAAIGSTRVARMAGIRLASTVTIVPTSSETMIVRVAKMVLPCGRSMPNDVKSASRPFASPRPRKSPITDATTPITNPSMITERRTCRRVAPRVRSVPNSRARCAIVIESVFAITKMPTNSAMPPNASRNFCRMLVKSLVSLTCFAACCAPLRTCVAGGRIGLISRHELRRRDTRLRRDVDLVELPDLAEERLRCRQVEDRHRRAADRRDVAELHDAGDLVLLHRPAGDRADRLSDRRSASCRRSPCRSRSRAVRAATCLR